MSVVPTTSVPIVGSSMNKGNHGSHPGEFVFDGMKSALANSVLPNKVLGDDFRTLPERCEWIGSN